MWSSGNAFVNSVEFSERSHVICNLAPYVHQAVAIEPVNRD